MLCSFLKNIRGSALVFTSTNFLKLFLLEYFLPPNACLFQACPAVVIVYSDVKIPVISICRTRIFGMGNHEIVQLPDPINRVFEYASFPFSLQSIKYRILNMSPALCGSGIVFSEFSLVFSSVRNPNH